METLFGTSLMGNVGKSLTIGTRIRAVMEILESHLRGSFSPWL